MAPKVAKYADGFELSTHYIGDDMKPMQDAIRAAIEGGGGKPVYVKVSPFRDVAKAAKAAKDVGVTGIVAVNSYGPCMALDIERMGMPFMGSDSKYGWMSGPAIKPIALRAVYDICKEVDLPVVGVGGISTGRDAIEYLMAGASACGICTAAIVEGRDVFNTIAQEMTEWMQEHGIKHVEDLIGLAQKKPVYKQVNPPKVDATKCVGCGTCVTSCLYEAMQLNDEGVAHADPSRCFRCGLCYTRCPAGAISLD